jgi:hypothetical protein
MTGTSLRHSPGAVERHRLEFACSMAAVLTICALASCAAVTPYADPDSDAPEHRPAASQVAGSPGSYEAALGTWRTAEDINAWIGARFEYDFQRAARLSESQRARVDRVQIHSPGQFFASPSGVCVDLARFAVETLRIIDPASRPAYLMIEFDPVVISGNTLRRHWVASFRRDGQWYIFADSKRPGHVAGPYGTLEQFIDEYAGYRGRRIVSYGQRESYERTLKKRATRSDMKPLEPRAASDRAP